MSARGNQLENVINVYSRKQAARIQKDSLTRPGTVGVSLTVHRTFLTPFIPHFMSKKCKNSFKGKTVFLPVILGFQRSKNGGDELSIPQLVTISIPNMLLDLREQRMSRWLIALGIRCQTQLLTELLFVLTCRVLLRRGIITSHRNSLSKAHRLIQCRTARERYNSGRISSSRRFQPSGKVQSASVGAFYSFSR